VLRARREGRALELYYEPGDPHSHLCAQLLPMLAGRVRAPIRIRLVRQLGLVDYPEPERQRAYALMDAARIAPARGLTFPADAQVPSDAARAGAAVALAPLADDPQAFAAREAEVAAELFAGRDLPLDDGAGAVDDALTENNRRRKALGHYLPAMWQFDGDWFWSVDRLHHLEVRLRERDALGGAEPLSELHPERAALPDPGTPLPPLEFFYSFRSPYSYLAVAELQRFHERWPSEVRVRPVLPMAMRSMTVNRLKQLYTLRDVRREGERYGVPFGRVADPLGDGATRLLQVFPLATSSAQQIDYLVAAARATWSEGVDVAGDDGLRYVCETAGIPWDAAHARVESDADIDYAEQNRRDLFDLGLWGVPDYHVGPFTAWGRDRFWMLEELLRRSERASLAA
jgi:2-hydroxychromene-2-carboxylate isomerase